MKIRRFLAITLAGLACSTLASTVALGQNLFLGGTQMGAYSNFSYLGYLHPLQGRLGEGWYLIGLVNYLQYRYNSGSPTTTVRTRAPGLHLGLGYAGGGHTLQWSLSAAVGYANFLASPKVIPNAAAPAPQGGVWTFQPQLQWHLNLNSQFALAGIDNYTFGQKSYWTEWKGEWKAAPALRIGPEGVLQGGQNYQIHQVGLSASLGPFSGWQLGLAAGVSYQSGLPDSGYGGLSFSKSF